jgi:hypothetical protein
MSPDAADVAARLRSEGLDPSTWSNGPGDRYAAHEHGYDKVIAVESGAIDFELPASSEVISLAAGDRLELPAGTLHAAVVGQAAVTCWEAHLVAGGFSEPTRRRAGEW